MPAPTGKFSIWAAKMNAATSPASGTVRSSAPGGPQRSAGMPHGDRRGDGGADRGRRVEEAVRDVHGPALLPSTRRGRALWRLLHTSRNWKTIANTLTRMSAAPAPRLLRRRRPGCPRRNGAVRYRGRSLTTGPPADSGDSWSGFHSVPDGRPRPVMSKMLSRPARSSMPVQQASSAVWAGFALLGAVRRGLRGDDHPRRPLLARVSTCASTAGSSAGGTSWRRPWRWPVPRPAPRAGPCGRGSRRPWPCAPSGSWSYVLFVRTDQAPPPARPGRTPPGWPAPAPCWWDCGCSAGCMPRVAPRRWSWMR